MDITYFKKHVVTECDCCGKLIFVKADREEGSNTISALYALHLKRSEKCKKYHNSLPKFADLRKLGY